MAETDAKARRLLSAPRPPVNSYPAHVTLSERQLRALMAMESYQALKLAREAGVEVPCARPTT